MQRLQKEIREYRDTRYSREPVETIYFGGGTPSLLEPGQVEQIVTTLDEVFVLEPREITFEMNPDDVSAEFLKALKELGVNRASMGVQTFQPELLRFMNRAHSREEAIRCMELLSRSSFDSFTVDLIYGNPGQSIEQLSEDLDTLLTFNPPHVSAYSLTIEPGTRLGKQLELGRIAPPEDDKVAEHFELINRRFEDHGIKRYEVSNYSRPGCEAVHNSHYWKHRNYLGLGPAAHSFWWDEESVRWENESNLRNYLRGNMERTEEQLTSIQLAEERIMMGLRTREGIGISELSRKYDYSLAERQMEYLREKQGEGKVKLDDRIVLTNKGIRIADAIILDLVTLH